MKRLSFIVFFTMIFVSLFAQIPDEQVVVLLQNAQKQGMGQQEMIVMLTQKGVTPEQLKRIKSNFDKDGTLKASATPSDDRTRKQDVSKGQGDRRMLKEQRNVGEVVSIDSLEMILADNERKKLSQKERENLVFGRNIFNNDGLTFEPNLNIATPENYVLGPGDEVLVDIWGDSQQNIRQTISPDGSIVVDQIGPVYLNGLTVREANVRLKKAFSQIYSALNAAQPTTFINLSLGKIRSIQVNVMGEVVVPGTYTLSSLASLFHALYSAGGVNEIGTLRTIKVNRGGKEVADVDIYDYLLKGRNDLDIRLQDGDVIVVSPYQNLVGFRGKVKRPMRYEMKGEETVGDLLNFAGGFTGDAYKKAVRVIRKSGREHQVFNVDATDFGQFVLTDGDAVSVDSVMSRFENRIEIRGAVYREGLYALGDAVSTVKQLLEKAEGLRGDAFVNRAVLYRERPDFTLEVEALNIAGILNGSVTDVKLQKNDVLYIPSVFDLQEEYTVTIGGAVGIPGTYKYAGNMTLEDLVIQAGGLKESASMVKVDVARRIKDPKSTEVGELRAENFTFTLKDGLIVSGDKKHTLSPFDEVYVRNSPGYQVQQNVGIEGEVLFDGTYVLSKKGERLSDLVKKAGGLTPEAYARGARLTRKLSVNERARVETLLKLTKQGGRDSIDVGRLDIGNTYYVGIELRKALDNPGSDYDVVLREGDRLYVPEYAGTVKISGAVMYPNTVVYQKNEKLKHYIEQGGGFADRAKKRKVFIVYMNGTVSKSKTFSKANAAPGCEVIVPTKAPRKGSSLAEIMSLASSTTSMAAMVTSILNMTK